MRTTHHNRLPAITRVSVIAFTYIITISGWFLLWSLTTDEPWWLTLLNRIVPTLFAPTVPLLLLALITRHWRTAAALLWPAVLFFLIYHTFFWPHPAEKRAEPPPLRVMTFNILYSNTDTEGLAAVIRTQAPDLVALQEVTPAAFAALTTSLSDRYPHAVIATDHPYGTTAILSRTPFVELIEIDLGADRPAMAVITEIDGQEIGFASLHLLAFGLRWVAWSDLPQVIDERHTAQNQQVKQIINFLNGREEPFIIGCDCNSDQTGRSTRLLAETMHNTSDIVGLRQWLDLPDGVQVDNDLTHIDYIFWRGELAPADLHLLRERGGSDHRPLQAAFYVQQVDGRPDR